MLMDEGHMVSQETTATQEFTQQTQFTGVDSEEDEIESAAWGKLLPLQAGYDPKALVNDSYTMGRHAQCDIVFNNNTMSNNHCRIFKSYGMHPEHDRLYGYSVYLDDTSTNGTYVNGHKVGKGNRILLDNDYEIGLPIKHVEPDGTIRQVKTVYLFRNLSSGGRGSDDDESTGPYHITSISLGTGNFAEVKVAVHRDTAYKVAAKIIDKKKLMMSATTQEQLKQEADILKAVDHPCVIDIIDVYETEDHLYIMLELVTGGALFEYIVSRGTPDQPARGLDEETAKKLFYQMLLGVKYLHDHGITHRDLKPENVLLEPEGDDRVIKITDFGLAKMVGENIFMKTLCGTPNYLAPEMITDAGKDGYTKQVDCWSLGVILYIWIFAMVTSPTRPIDERRDLPMNEQITRGSFFFHPSNWRDVSLEAQDLIRKLLTVDPAKRLTVDGALEHPWLKDEEMRRHVHRLLDAVNVKKCKVKKSLSGVAVNSQSMPQAMSLGGGNGDFDADMDEDEAEEEDSLGNSPPRKRRRAH